MIQRADIPTQTGLWLVYSRPSKPSRVHRVPRPETCVVGSSPGADVTVPDRFLSRFHFAVGWAGGHWYAEDLASTNGTLLNGHPLTGRRPLPLPAVIEAGLQRFSLLPMVGSAHGPGVALGRLMTEDASLVPLFHRLLGMARSDDEVARLCGVAATASRCAAVVATSRCAG